MSFVHADHLLILALLLSLIGLTLTTSATLLAGRRRRRRRAAERATQRQWTRRLADASFDGLLIHRAGIVLQVNNALIRLLGARESELRGQNFAYLAVAAQTAALRTELEAPRPQPAEFTLLRADKTELTVELASHNIEHEGAAATVTAIRDITQRRADATRIFRLTHYDALTGLPNRRLFVDRLGAAIAAGALASGGVALFAIDIDQFKGVNELIGRAGGDQLLKQVTARIAALIDPADTLGRLSGDKFAVILPIPAAAAAAGNASTSTSTTDKAQNFTAGLAAAFAEAFIVDGHLVNASLSTGIACYPDHAEDADGLLRAADFALKQAGRAGGGFAHQYSHEEANGFRAALGRDMFRVGLTETQRLSQDLRHALASHEIALVYQPIFRTEDLTLVGYEALARWHHKSDGLIAPNIFIPLAEQAGLIHEIGAHVLETACAEAAAHPGRLKVAVNLSPLQFRDAQLPARITATLRRTGLDPSLLELEVTESLLIENSAAAAEALTALAAIGVSIALDDFGTGYSSLSYLCDYPFTRLKIDKRFIQALGQDPNADAIVVAILSLARNLSLEVTAEGVETATQLAFLHKNGCPQVQGYLLGRPGPRHPPATAAKQKPALPHTAQKLISSQA